MNHRDDKGKASALSAFTATDRLTDQDWRDSAALAQLGQDRGELRRQRDKEEARVMVDALASEIVGSEPRNAAMKAIQLSWWARELLRLDSEVQQ